MVSAAAESDELSDILPVLRVARLYEKDELTPVAGDLSDINARITALEQKYGFSIYFGPEVPKRIDYYDIHQFKNKDKLSVALDSLEEILGCLHLCL